MVSGFSGQSLSDQCIHWSLFCRSGSVVSGMNSEVFEWVVILAISVVDGDWFEFLPIRYLSGK